MIEFDCNIKTRKQKPFLICLILHLIIANSYKKKARVDLDTDIVYTIDEPICTSNSDIVITRKSNINNEDLVSKYRKTINFDHLKKSKEINITYLSGEKSKIRMYESEDMYQVEI